MKLGDQVSFSECVPSSGNQRPLKKSCAYETRIEQRLFILLCNTMFVALSNYHTFKINLYLNKVTTMGPSRAFLNLRYASAHFQYISRFVVHKK